MFDPYSIRICNDCGKVWTNVNEDECPLCFSINTEILFDNDEDIYYETEEYDDYYTDEEETFSYLDYGDYDYEY